MISSSPLIARSSDGSLIGIHRPDTSSTSNNSSGGLIRLYDGNISNGSLKFSLRIPSKSSTNQNSDNETTLTTTKDNLRKLIFASASNNNSTPAYLCGLKASSILLYDLSRGVLSTTIDIHNQADASSSKKSKKKRKSSINSTGNEVLCDIASSGNSLYALIYFPNDDDSSSESEGKCRLYQYNLSSEGGGAATLVKKIKVGSVTNSGSSAKPMFGVNISKSSIVLRIGNVVRVVDLNSGEKLCKVDMMPADANDAGEVESGTARASYIVPMAITACGSYIVISNTIGQAVVFSYAKDDEKEKHSLQMLAVLSSKATDEPISHLDITTNKNEDELSIVAFQSTVNISSLFTISTTDSSSVPQTPRATLQTNEADKLLTFIGCTFHPRTPSESLLLLFSQAKHAGGSAAASGGTSLPMESVVYTSLEGKVTVGTSLSTLNDKGKGNKATKRKGMDNNVALAPGDQGQEASLAADLSQQTKKKKAKVVVATDGGEAAAGDDDDKDDDFDFDMDVDEDDEDGEQGQSIAERLALLSSAMAESDSESDEDDDDDDEDESSAAKQQAPPKPFKLKSATSETLTTLLSQALSSNDSSQLNIALQVTDRRLVEGTVRSLQLLDAERAAKATADGGDSTAAASTPGYIPTLMAHIVQRMARKHSLVIPLSVWVKAILAAAARSSTLHAGSDAVEEIMAQNGVDVAMKLGPLKNFLNERVECFPQLLRLQGRLSLLNQHL